MIAQLTECTHEHEMNEETITIRDCGMSTLYCHLNSIYLTNFSQLILFAGIHHWWPTKRRLFVLPRILHGPVSVGRAQNNQLKGKYHFSHVCMSILHTFADASKYWYWTEKWITSILLAYKPINGHNHQLMSYSNWGKILAIKITIMYHV